MKNILLRLTFVALLLACLMTSTAFVGVQSSHALSICKPSGIQCLDVWDPVICDNGQVYSNFCYARLACATGCVPFGGSTS
ncbi:MAG TPA: hypothetical protein VLV83_12945 [Acidobacteriota bacterium]|nr:hypothetical protein [Acidobacteriota bacterium]